VAGSVRAWWREQLAVGRWELWLLGGAIALGVAVRVGYVLATRHLTLIGDEVEYDLEGQLIAHGHWWWSVAWTGHLHPSAWKAPLYPLWLGAWYTVIGHSVFGVRLIEALTAGPAMVLLTWLLARRLFGPRVAAASAVVVAIYPLTFQYETLLFCEALAVPLGLGFLLLALTGKPTVRRAAGAGVLLGAALLIRPTSFLLLVVALVAWGFAAGLRRGVGLTAVTVAVAIACVAPWTIRNAVVEHGFLPISLQDASAFAVFNPDSARDPVWPYAPRVIVPSWSRELSKPAGDMAFRARLNHLAFHYIRTHPESLLYAFYWNGLTRFWDVRHPSRALPELQLDGQSHLLARVGLYSYWVLLALALVGLWRARRRRGLVLALLAFALAGSLLFAGDGRTRYRQPWEPVIVILACSAIPLGLRRRQAPVGQPPATR
jgi:4-amino-4-deoxy-L-arabinose transferase-like glycosyltransferase